MFCILISACAVLLWFRLKRNDTAEDLPNKIAPKPKMRIFIVIWISIKVLSWFVFRALYQLGQNVVWRLTGISRRIDASRKSDAYHGSAHAQTVRFRFKMDLMIQPANVNNFVTTHHSFVDPEYVLAHNVTLYTLTRHSAVFVESDVNVDATSSKFSSFFRIAQFQQAKRLIIVPLHVFHRLANQIGDPKGRLIFLTNTSRCGSTLLTQVFEETGKSIALSEPDAMYALTALCETLPGSAGPAGLGRSAGPHR